MPSLLIVDDDQDVAEPLGEILGEAGYDVRFGANGKEGLNRVAESLPDAVLLDVEMPILSGPDMAHQLFVDDVGREKIPIILLAGVVNLSRIAALVGTPYF